MKNIFLFFTLLCISMLIGCSTKNIVFKNEIAKDQQQYANNAFDLQPDDDIATVIEKGDKYAEKLEDLANLAYKDVDTLSLKNMFRLMAGITALIAPTQSDVNNKATYSAISGAALAFSFFLESNDTTRYHDIYLAESYKIIGEWKAVKATIVDDTPSPANLVRIKRAYNVLFNKAHLLMKLYGNRV